MNTFLKYPSITNHYQKDFVDKAKSLNCDFYITEKLDGANLSICVDNGNILAINSRNGEVSNDFYGINSIDLKDFLKSINLKSFIVYGEIFGNKIQKRIKYSNLDNPNILFFDIYDLEQERFLNLKELKETLKDKMVPLLAENLSLEDALSFDNDFISTLSSQSGNSSKAEGIIIKPEEDKYLGVHRVIIKKKHQSFLEIKSHKKQSNPISFDEINSISFDGYININRIEAVKSKEIYNLPQDTARLINDVFNDAIDEYQKLNQPLSKKELSLLKKKYTHNIKKLIFS